MNGTIIILVDFIRKDSTNHGSEAETERISKKRFVVLFSVHEKEFLALKM